MNILEYMPDDNGYELIKEPIYALLSLSELCCKRFLLSPNHIGNECTLKKAPHEITRNIRSLLRKVKFSEDDIKSHGLTIESLAPFFFSGNDRNGLSQQELGNSKLERFPIIFAHDNINLVLPTAIYTAIIRYLFEKLNAVGMKEAFVQSLAQEYGELFTKSPLLGGDFGAPLKFNKINGEFYACVAQEVDSGRYLNLILILDSLNGFEDTAFVPFKEDPNRHLATIDKFIDQIHESVSTEPNFVDGITLVVGCSIGRGYYFNVSEKNRKNWRLASVSAPQLHTLNWLKSYKPLSLWRILDGEEKLKSMGVHLFNLNGLLNLVAWSQSLDGHLVPHGDIPNSFSTGSENFVTVEQNALAHLRENEALRWDVRAVQDINSNWIIMRRYSESIFKEDESIPTYVAPEKTRNGGPATAHLTSKRPWWCEINSNNCSNRALLYERWRVLVVWLQKSAQVIDDMLTNLPSGAILWKTEFETLNVSLREKPPVLDYAGALSELEVKADVNKRTIVIIVGRKFEHAVGNPTNIAEKALVVKLVEGAIQLTGEKPNQTAVNAIVSKIITSPHARQMHAFIANKFHHHVSQSISEPPITINGDDSALLTLGLGWSARDPNNGNEIKGKSECIKYLNTIVRNLENKLCDELKNYNRENLIKCILENHERASFDKSTWQSTASAVVALHNNTDDVYNSIIKHNIKLNGVFQASRLLIEFALAESPLSNGRKIGKLDLSRLMNLVMTIVSYGGWSDGIRWDAISPKIIITTLGDIQVDHSFMDNILTPFFYSGAELNISSDVDNYSKNYDDVEPKTSISEVFETDFLNAWDKEFDISINTFQRFISFLFDLGTERKQAVFTVVESDFYKVCQEEDPLTKEQVQKIIEVWTFPETKTWREIPDGYTENDRFPWRFKRRLSILRKPLIKISLESHSIYYVAPDVVQTAFLYTFDKCHRGGLS